jgi:intracellular septation protein
MKSLIESAKLVILDLASTFMFLVVFELSNSIPLAFAAGVALGVGQVGWQLARKQPVGSMQWASVLLVLGFGAAALMTNDPRFVMFKPTLIYLIIGVVMLKPGWMVRYMSARAMEIVPDIAFIFGYLWAALMFVSAALNAFVVTRWSVEKAAAFMSAYAIISEVGLFLVQYAVMRIVVTRRRARAAAGT